MTRRYLPERISGVKYIIPTIMGVQVAEKDGLRLYAIGWVALFALSIAWSYFLASIGEPQAVWLWGLVGVRP